MRDFCLFLIKPFTILYALCFFLTWSTDKNYIKKQDVVLTGLKKNAICKQFDTTLLKKVAKTKKAKLNDVVLAMLSVSLSQYLKANGDDTCKSINLLVPFSLRTIPKTIDRHAVVNNFSPLCFTLQIHEDFELALEQISR